MLTLVILTLFLVMVLGGWGRLCLLALKRFRFGSVVDYGFFDAAVLGTFAVTATALLLNLFVGISTGVTYAFTAIGVTGVATRLGNLRNMRLAAFAHRGTILACVGFAILYSVRFIEVGPSYDAGLYHIPYMNWVSAGPVPFGLANLEGRLGFNSSWLMFDASFRTSYLGWSHLKVTESAVWTLASCVMFERLMRGWKTLPAHELPTLVALAVVSGIFAWRIGSYGVSNTDDAPSLFALLSALYFIHFFVAFRASDHARAFAGMLLHLCCAALAITGKMAMAPVALLSSYCFVLAITHGRGRMAYVWASITAFFMGVWLIRGLIISGCAAYPVPFTCLDTLSWGVRDPASMVKTIVAWARKPGPDYLEALNSLDWVRPWGARMLYDNSIVRLTVLLLVAGACCMMLLRRKSIAPSSAMYPNLAHVLGGLGALGLLLWLLSAPDPRFSWAFFVLLTIPSTAVCIRLLGANVVLQRAASLLTRRHARTVIVASFAILLTYYQVQFPSLRDTMRIPTPPVFETRLETSTVNVSRPAYRDQCWDTSIPCTPDLAKDLVVDHWMGRLRFRANNSAEVPIGPK